MYHVYKSVFSGNPCVPPKPQLKKDFKAKILFLGHVLQGFANNPGKEGGGSLQQ